MFDIIIRNGSVLDGSGAEAQKLDVGVKDGKIAALGDLKAAEATEVIDAAGRTVCPGFLDLHRHADAAVFRDDFGAAEACWHLDVAGLRGVVAMDANGGSLFREVRAKSAARMARLLKGAAAWKNS